jgi:hypothetical protein
MIASPPTRQYWEKKPKEKKPLAKINDFSTFLSLKVCNIEKV